LDELQLIVRRAVDQFFAEVEPAPSAIPQPTLRQREPTLFIRGDDGPAIAPERTYAFEFPLPPSPYR